MRFLPAKLEGVYRLELEPCIDERGFLARTFCADEFSARGLHATWQQCNLTHTRERGTIRGLHFQAKPGAEIKLIRCGAGSIHDVLVDVRPASPTFGQWEAFALSGENNRMLYVPGGIAHGFQCLSDDCRLYYQMSASFAPELVRGVRWNDPALGIRWPIAEAQLSERDRDLPSLAQLAAPDL